jgi:hypothetical protein
MQRCLNYERPLSNIKVKKLISQTRSSDSPSRAQLRNMLLNIQTLNFMMKNFYV